MAKKLRRTQKKRQQKNLHAVALGKLGGLHGGPARAAVLSAGRRREIARMGASAKHGKR